jgi:hypothetical protein
MKFNRLVSACNKYCLINWPGILDVCDECHTDLHVSIALFLYDLHQKSNTLTNCSKTYHNQISVLGLLRECIDRQSLRS